MRIADYFMRRYPALNNRDFLVGNIAPDCGVPDETGNRFTPGKEVTHWRSPESGEIDAADFAEKYLRQKDEKYPFYLGYYFHLLTDTAWKQLYQKKKREPIYADGLAADPNFIWTAKRDWSGQDHLFLQRNSNFVFFTLFANIQSFENVYFDFYPATAFTDRIQYITRFYCSAKEDSDRPFPFLSRAEMDGFVDETCLRIECDSFRDGMIIL